ncbi:MAG: DNA-binding protein, partial [Oscillospiraceae bacterium]|nr:DNA-binding protein [Oscillospiraceae bacterium]
MNKNINNILTASYTVFILLGIITCAIVDLAVTKGLTWSLISISASIFAWIVFTPAIKFGAKGIVTSLISLNIFIIPFLYVLNMLIDSNNLLLPIGIWSSVIGIAYIWIEYFIFKYLKFRVLTNAAISVLLAIPLSLGINYVLLKTISAPFFDIWDAMSIAIILAVVIILFFIDF